MGGVGEMTSGWGGGPREGACLIDADCRGVMWWHRKKVPIQGEENRSTGPAH